MDLEQLTAGFSTEIAQLRSNPVGRPRREVFATTGDQFVVGNDTIQVSGRDENKY